MGKRGRKTQLRQVRAYLNPEQPEEAAICEFVEKAVRMRSGAAVRAMLRLAWAQMQTFERGQFEAHFPDHRFQTFERIRRSASPEADSPVSIPPSPKIK